MPPNPVGLVAIVAALTMAINARAYLSGGSEHAMHMTGRTPMPTPGGRNDPPMDGCHACPACVRTEQEDAKG